VDPCSGKRKRVDCSSLVDEITNQALHDEAQQIFALEGYVGLKEFRDKCARGWLASMKGARPSSLPVPTGDEEVVVADSRAQELRWVHVDPHCRASDVTTSEQLSSFLRVEQAVGESAL
jgi:hypothetical protein